MVTSSTDLELLKILSSRENYLKYRDSIKSRVCTPESWQIIEDFGEWFDSHPNNNEIDWSDFRLWFRIQGHPGFKHEQHQMYDTIFNNIRETTVDDQSNILHYFERENTYQQILDAIQKRDDESLMQLLGTLQRSNVQTTSDLEPFSLTVEEILEKQDREGGLSFRLEDLNQAIGELHKGDFLAVGKRPEVGGTSFLCSEFTHMVKQLPEGKHACIFNNEEDNYKILLRCIQASLNIHNSDIYARPAQCYQDYQDYLDGKEIHIYGDDVSRDINQINRVLETDRYGLIGINVLLKIEGVKSGRRNLEDHDKMEYLGSWARQVSKAYGPVIAVAQADPSAEGCKYPDQHQIYKAKTGFPGETDVLIMIGRMEEEPDTRYIRVARNKLPGTSKTHPHKRHGKFPVNFDPETGRFTTRIGYGKT